ncbi:MAG: beta-ketoacyl-ACP synthase III [Pseudomonadota bacterium]
MRRALITGVGSCLPDKVVTNDDLSRTLDTSDEWIRARTGISERRVASDGELTSDLGAEAARRALAHAGIEAAAVDLLIVATATPDQTFPATAAAIQDKLGLTEGAAFDVQAVCSGFIFALALTRRLVECGDAKTALVVGAETFSRILDWTDRATCVLFGDGAGAVVVEAGEGAGTNADRGILGHHLRTDGSLRSLLYVDGGPSSTQTAGHVRMRGPEVFKNAVKKISESIEVLLEKNGLVAGDVALFVPHQANERIITAVADRVGLDMDRIVNTVGHHGNTSAASIPLALDTAAQEGRLKRGDLVLFEALGGGLTWGSVLARW